MVGERRRWIAVIGPVRMTVVGLLVAAAGLGSLAARGSRAAIGVPPLLTAAQETGMVGTSTTGLERPLWRPK